MVLIITGSFEKFFIHFRFFAFIGLFHNGCRHKLTNFIISNLSNFRRVNFYFRFFIIASFVCLRPFMHAILHPKLIPCFILYILLLLKLLNFHYFLMLFFPELFCDFLLSSDFLVILNSRSSIVNPTWRLIITGILT